MALEMSPFFQISEDAFGFEGSSPCAQYGAIAIDCPPVVSLHLSHISPVSWGIHLGDGTVQGTPDGHRLVIVGRRHVLSP